MGHFGPELFEFLRELKANNTREWFLAEKERYEAVARGPMLQFIGDLADGLHGIAGRFDADPRPVGGSLFRIHRDTRFARDKTPYKTHLAAHFRHRSALRDVHAPGFYLHLEPAGCFIGAGIWHPEPGDLKRIRDAIVAQEAAWRRIRKQVPPLAGDAAKRPPAGYDPAHPLIDDLKRKDFFAEASFTEAQVCGPDFMADYLAACRTMAPLVRFVTKAVGLAW